MPSQDDELRPLQFLVDLPYLSQRKLAIIQLVAKYSVLDPTQLAKHNFDFLEPQHSLHSLFELYKTQYELVKNGAQPPEGDVLRRAILRAHSSIKDSQPGKQTVQASTSHSSIDWQDFVVLESVEFFSADLNGKSNLSAPFTEEELRLQRHKDEHIASTELVFKSAITGELVPASQYNDHIRILTLDPKSRIQKAKEQERNSSTNLEFSNVSENLAALRQKRRRLLEEH